MGSVEERLAEIDISERILLLPHCLRRSETCRAKYDKHGLQCCKCNPECPVNILSSTAAELGYKGICVAPGGRMAVNYVKELRPEAVVAVACEKELEEGIHSIRGLDNENIASIPVVIIPLSRDGCVDTDVDEEQALKMINLGYSTELVKGGPLQL